VRELRYLNTLDYSVIITYCVILLAMGIYLQRKASRSLEDYFLGGRNLPWWALGISGMTNFLDMAGTMVIVSFLFMLGPRGLYVEFRGGAVLVLVFWLLWTGKWHYRSKCMTGAEWMIYRFGTGAGAQFARLITAIASITLSIGMLAYLVKGAGLFLPMFIPLSPMWCAGLMVALTTVYTVMSGFYGVVYNDLFQGGVILISVVVISVMAALKVIGYEGDFGALAASVTSNPDWMSSWPHRQTAMPHGYEEFQWLRFAAFFYLLRNVIWGMATGDDQRYFGARSERECGLLTYFWTCLMMFRWPMMIAFAVLGIFLVHQVYPDAQMLTTSANLIKQHVPGVAEEQWENKLAEIAQRPEAYPELGGELTKVFGKEWPGRIQLVSYRGTINPERILPAVILSNVPAGLRGLLIASLLAAAMSTLSPEVNRNTAYFTRDIYQAYVHKRASTRELIWASYGFSVLLVLAGFLMAARTKNINDIWDWIAMALGAGIIIPKLFRLYWWRFNGAGVFWGTLAGLVGALAYRYYFSVMHPELPGWAPWTKFGVFSGVAFVGAVLGTYTSPPADRKVLEHFYKTTRPFGFWGPLKGILRPEVREAMNREHRQDIMGVPFALLWQITLFLLPMQLIIGSWRSFWPTLAIFVGSWVGLMVVWYRHLPSKEVGSYPSSILMGAEQHEPSPALAAMAAEREAREEEPVAV
jgi:solute:Na+ symporter, SSS family